MTFLAAPPRQSPRRLRTADAAAVFVGLRQSEKAFQAEVVRYATQQGWRCYFTFDSRHSPKGWPDLVLVRARHPKPRVVFAELKSQRNRLTADQKLCLDELRACGQETYTWRPSDWQTIEKVLRR